MNRIVFTGALVALLALALGFAACGGDDDDDGNGVSNIRTEKGLAVAALAAEINGGVGVGAGSVSAEADDAAAPALAEDNVSSRGIKDIAVDPFSPIYGPAQQAAGDGISVVGYGSATADADSAVVEFYFGRSGNGVTVPGAEGRSSSGADDAGGGSSGSSGVIEPVPAPDADSPDLQVPPEVQPITEPELQPVIDGLVAAGVARDNIEFIGQGYYDPYFASATLRATVGDVNAVDGVVQAAVNAVGGVPNIQLQSTNVSYTLSDCAALERAAMEAAVDDARERGQVLAEVLGVGLGGVTGAANYSYSPYGGTPCDTGYFGGPIPLGGIEYLQGQPREVQVFAQINVTFAMQ